MWQILFLAALVAGEPRVRFDGYQSLSVGPLHTKRQMAVVLSLEDEDSDIHKVMLMNDAVGVGQAIELQVAPEVVTSVKATLDDSNIPYEVVREDVQKYYDEVDALNQAAKESFIEANGPALTSCSSGQLPEYYMTNSEMLDWIDCMADRHSSIASADSIGTTYEGRSIGALRINGAGASATRVYIDATTHAREWISASTAVYTAWRILEDSDATMRESYNFLIVPVVNPDGYDYCHSTNRNWRKNRGPGSCRGTDNNRNFPFNWGGYGTSTNPCSDTYGGSSAGSEIETQAVMNAVNNFQNGNLEVAISMHSYSQLWLVNWAGVLDKPTDYNELMRVGNLAGSAIQGVNGRTFQVGTAPDLLYAASGCTYDWTKDGGGATYSYTPELRPATAAGGGFVLPASQIEAAGEESYAGIVAVCEEA